MKDREVQLNSPTIGRNITVYINLSSTAKLNRAAVINTMIGPTGLLQVYSGSPPLSPDYPATGTLLAALTLPTVAGRVVYSVQQVVVNSAGVNGTSGTTLVTGTTGTGIPFQVSVQIAQGSISAIQSIALAGAYDVSPDDLSNEPVSGGGLIGASLRLVMTAQLNFATIPQGVILATGVAGYARVTDSAGVGIIDLDIDVIQPTGTPNPSVVVNTINLVVGGPISVLTDILVEA